MRDSLRAGKIKYTNVTQFLLGPKIGTNSKEGGGAKDSTEIGASWPSWLHCVGCARVNHGLLSLVV